MGGCVSIPIDHFLWTHKFQKSESLDRLLYYDSGGTFVEQDIKSGAIEDVLKVFDGKVKSVRRSSGGLVSAQPHQVVLVTTDSPAKTSVRIRVRFKDLRFEEHKGLLVASCFSHTKVVAPEELKEPFNLNFNESQQFVLDLGNGIMPIYVIHYDTDSRGTTNAFFVEFSEMERALNAEPGTRPLIQPYCVPREVLRYASVKPERQGRSDYEIARENLHRMQRLGAIVVPECLMVGDPIAVPVGASEVDIRDFLQLTIVEHREALNSAIEPMFYQWLRGVEDEEAPILVAGT